MNQHTNISHLSGKQFANLLRKELIARNRGLARVSCEALGRSCGVSGKQLRRIVKEGVENPSALTIRLVLHTLGYQIPQPEDDVLPYLRSNGIFNEELHSAATQRRAVSATDIAASGEEAAELARQIAGLA